MQQIKEKFKERLPWTAKLYKKLTAKKWPDKSIVFYTGKHRSGPTADQLERGASGSHAAVIYLSKEWAKLGYQVTVYSNCPGKEGIFDGVEYVNQYKFNWEDTFDTLIIWRNPLINYRPEVKAKRLWLEWQDVPHPPAGFTRERLAKFDKIFAKCQYHRNLLPDEPDRKFAIISNGVDRSIAQLSSNLKQPYKLVYASRYYRGLDSMLTYGWPIIKREIPEAELHIYYGFAPIEMQPERAEWRENLLKLMSQPGVFEHGQVGQPQLIQEKSTCAIHYYACTYEEIDCISVRESAMVGCVPVTTDFAAMMEKQYCVKVPGEPKSQETQEAVAYKVVELLKNPEKLAAIREEFKQAVKDETWDNIAKRWVEN